MVVTEPAAHIEVKFKKLDSSVEPSVLSYLRAHGWDLQHSKLAADAKAGKLVKRDGYYWVKDINTYAKTWCKIATTTTVPEQGNDRLKTAMAEEREFRVGILKGEYINAAEEEARDAKLWGAIKSDLENHATVIVHELINRLLPIIEDDDLKAKTLALAHELRLTYEDALADIFDRYAKDGGIEA